MILRQFYIQIIIRTALILANCIAAAYVSAFNTDYLLLANLLVLLGIQVWLLLKSVNRVNHTLAGFFESLQMEDLTMSYKGNINSVSFERLNRSIMKIGSQLKNSRLAEMERIQYFKVVTEHVNVGLIAFDQDGKVEMFNRAASVITGIKTLKNVTGLKETMPGMAMILEKIKPSEQKLIKLKIGSEDVPVAVRISEIKFRERYLKLVSLQNIREELDEKELESWQQLIRILTHEIMNSVGPIISSIETISGFLSDEESLKPKPIEELSNEIIGDTIRGMQIVKERSLGLREFVDNFRSLTILPQITLENIRVEEMLEEIQFLMHEQLKKNDINFNKRIFPANMEFQADRKSIMQLLINLINNSAAALVGIKNKHISITSFFGTNGEAIIQITDNGKGIDPEIREKIFIPFFTTRENGSGIGLSLAKQIMRQHGGKITVQSSPGEGTTFSLIF
jgi:two-component system, NtrC family, nitrogen regulation sensor histidine kinase NtrY